MKHSANHHNKHKHTAHETTHNNQESENTIDEQRDTADRLELSGSFFSRLFDDRGISDINDTTKRALVRWIKTYANTTEALNDLQTELQRQKNLFVVDNARDKQQAIYQLLHEVMGRHILHHAEYEHFSLGVHDQIALLVQVQAYKERLSTKEQERIAILRENILASALEKEEKLTIQNIMIDAHGNITLIVKRASGETIAISIDADSGEVSTIDTTGAIDLLPQEQKDIQSIATLIKDSKQEQQTRIKILQDFLEQD